MRDLFGYDLIKYITFKIQPIMYQRYDTVLPRRVAGATVDCHENEPVALEIPGDAAELGDYGFIGRDYMIRSLEEACQRQKQGAILIHGMAGMGKTTLAKGFLHWLKDTHWFGYGMFWVNFEEVRSVEYIVNRYIDALSGTNAMAAPLDAKMDFLIRIFREHPFMLVWDNFESASGVEGTEIAANLSDDDRAHVKSFVARLRGGKTKILITSRSPERWLDARECFCLKLDGLHGEELWAYCNAVLRDYGRSVDRRDPHFGKLIEELNGHPLALQAVLPLLAKQSAGDILDSLHKAIREADGGEGLGRLQAALGVFDQNLPDDFTPVLQLVGLHSGFADIDYVGTMLGDEPAKAHLRYCMARLETAGLCSLLGDTIYRLHPALCGYLRWKHPANEERRRAFVDFMGSYADYLAPKELYEQRRHYCFHEASFNNALREAEMMDMRGSNMALLQSLAIYAQKRRDYQVASRFYERLATLSQLSGNPRGVASAYHQLGVFAQEQRDFVTAEEWYKKSLAIKEKQDNEHGAASTYHQLGYIAQEQGDFVAAEEWYKRSLAIKEKQDDEHGAASTYHQLGRIAEERRDFVTAEEWYKKSLAIFLKLGDDYNAGIVKQSLTRLSEFRK